MSGRLLILIFLGIHISATIGGTHLKITNIACTTSPYYYYNHSCELKALSRYKTVATMKAWIKDQLRNTSVNIALQARNTANVYKPFLINTTINICRYFAKSMQGPYGIILKKVLAKFTNVNHTCPYTGVVIANNLYIDTGILPVILPRNSYKVILTFYEDYPHTNLGFLELSMELIEDNRTT